MSKTIKMKALRSLSASQSPTGKQILRGASYDVASEALAADHVRRGIGERVEPAAVTDTKGKAG